MAKMKKRKLRLVKLAPMSLSRSAPKAFRFAQKKQKKRKGHKKKGSKTGFLGSQKGGVAKTIGKNISQAKSFWIKYKPKGKNESVYD